MELYKNGELPDSALVPIDGERLSIPTANAFNTMRAAARADGVSLWITSGGGYRDLYTQAHMTNLSTESTVPVASAGLSTHGWGTRVDIGSYGAKWGADGVAREKWMLANGPTYGFRKEFVNDPNHFKHDGTTAIGGITLSLSTERYVGENGPKPGGGTGFNFLDWILTAVKNLAKRVEQINGRQEEIHNGQNATLKAIVDKLNAGQTVNVSLSEADTVKIALMIADEVKIPSAEDIATELSKRLAE